uniref:Complex III subunit 9 n=1 Tax=Strongyloides papillosus TaxID=174720 RepID=A0A0N5BV27_STREA
MSAVSSVFYNSFTKKFSTILFGATVSAFVFDFTFNKAIDSYWNKNNKGKLWKDIEPQVRA